LGPGRWQELVTLDNNPDHRPDIVHDLHQALPFGDNSFDEIHAYDVLEHVGAQGDWRFFFRQWSDFWRVLRPGGLFFGMVPSPDSPWAWGDPSHTRLLPPEVFTFLSQPEYTTQVGVTAISDFRFCYKADFDIQIELDHIKHLTLFALRAVKPSRITEPSNGKIPRP
jgi:SAM-dependent methyltransferase